MTDWDLRKAQNWRELADAMTYVRLTHRLSIKEFADKLGLHTESQMRAWLDARERPQLEAVWAVHEFRGALVVGLAKFAGLDVATEIRVPA